MSFVRVFYVACYLLQCTKNYSPVCASDCETYNNECEMVVAGCKNKQDLTVIYAGTCGEENIER